MLLAANTDPSFAIVAGICIVMVIVFAVALSFAMASKRNQQLAETARRYGGQLETGGLLSLPKIRFTYAGRNLLLTYQSQGDEGPTYKTNLAIPWPNRSLRCEIFPESSTDTLRKLIGMQDIQIGSPRFDDQFVITGNDEQAIKTLLTPEVQSRIAQLYNLKTGFSSASGIYLHIFGGWLTVSKNGYLVSGEELDPFLGRFLDLFDAANLILTPGVVFLDNPTAAAPTTPAADAPHCIVCGEPLTAELVSCRSCRTPHHRDCWQYFGGCATYACGGKQFVPKASGGR